MSHLRVIGLAYPLSIYLGKVSSYIIDRCIIKILACTICYNLAILSANEGTL